MPSRMPTRSTLRDAGMFRQNVTQMSDFTNQSIWVILRTTATDCTTFCTSSGLAQRWYSLQFDLLEIDAGCTYRYNTATG